MQLNEVKCYYSLKEKKDKRCNCLEIIFYILLFLFIGLIGLILGAVFSRILLNNMQILILGIVILGLLLVLIFIYKMCLCKKNKCC